VEFVDYVQGDGDISSVKQLVVLEEDGVEHGQGY
jgi:hypothetical protein